VDFLGVFYGFIGGLLAGGLVTLLALKKTEERIDFAVEALHKAVDVFGKGGKK